MSSVYVFCIITTLILLKKLPQIKKVCILRADFISLGFLYLAIFLTSKIINLQY